MKKSLLALVVVAMVSVVAMAGHFTETLPPAATYGATPVSNGYDWNLSTDSGAPVITASAPIQPWSRTIAQLNALAPAAAGQFVYCSNCVSSPICVSSATAAGSWTVIGSTGGPVALLAHCQ